MAETYHSLKEVCKRHLDYICLNSSCHGANWAMKIQSIKLKVFLQILAIILQFLLLASFIQVLFVEQLEITNKQSWEDNDGSFPNVTICSQRIFDKTKITGCFDSLISNFYILLSNIDMLDLQHTDYLPVHQACALANFYRFFFKNALYWQV
jgi:hypothetical protein